LSSQPGVPRLELEVLRKKLDLSVSQLGIPRFELDTSKKRLNLLSP
jgi:hypothetical protein